MIRASSGSHATYRTRTSYRAPQLPGNPYGWWRYFRSKDPTRADNAHAQPVARAHTQGKTLRGHVTEGHYGWRFITLFLVKRPHYGGYCATSGCAHPMEPSSVSLPVALSVMRNDTFCTTTIVRKNRGKALPGMRRTYFRWRHFKHAQWSDPLDPPQMWLELSTYTTSNHRVVFFVCPASGYPFFQTFLGVMFFMLCFNMMKNCEFWELLLVCTLANSFFMEGRVLLLIGSEPEEVHFCFFAFGRSSVSLLPLPFK